MDANLIQAYSMYSYFFNFRNSLQVPSFKLAKLPTDDLVKDKFVQLPVYVYLCPVYSLGCENLLVIMQS